MRILQINNYAYLKGGSEKVFIDTIALLRDHGQEVKAFSVKDDIENNTINGKIIKITPWNKRNGIFQKLKGVCDFIYNRKVAKELDKIINEFKPDIVHIHIYYGRLSNSIIKVLEKYKIPIVQSVHEYRLICPAYTCLTPQMEICEKCASERLKISCVSNKCIKNNSLLSLVAAGECSIRDKFFNNINKFSRFIMVSDFIRKLHIKHFPNIIDKAELLYNFIDLKSYSQYRTKTKEEYILYFGRLSKEKGIITLIDVMVYFPNLKLKIAGTGPLKDEISNYIKEKSLSNIELEGFVSGENLYQLISKAKFVIVPSEWYENNPLSIIESFALGTPVIASNIGGIPELVNNNVTGYLYEPKNVFELQSCINRGFALANEEYNSLVSNCIEFANDHFDAEKHYTSLMQIYEKAIKEER